MYKSVVLNSLCYMKNSCRLNGRNICGLVKQTTVEKNFLKTAAIFTVRKNNFFEREISPSVERSLKTADKIPNDYTIIYRAPLKWYVKISYYVVFASTSMLPVIVGGMTVLTGAQQFPVYLYGMILMNNSTDFFAFTAALLFITLKVSIVVHKYPFRIYADKERYNYIAVYQHFLPWLYQNLHFTRDQVSKARGFMPWKDSLYSFGKRKAILMEHYFTKPQEMNQMVCEGNQRQQF